MTRTTDIEDGIVLAGAHYAARWHRSDPLAMSPFRSTALKALTSQADR